METLAAPFAAFPPVIWQAIVAIIFGTASYLAFFKKSSKNLPLPPGPKPLPIVGNIFDLPPSGGIDHLHWLQFKDKYGPISSVTTLGQTVVLLHDREVVHDLMDKMSLKTSGRPQMYFANELCGFQKYLSSSEYNAYFRISRKLIHQEIGTEKSASRFHGIQDLESRRLLLRTLNNPNGLLQHFSVLGSSIILKTVYGYNIETEKADPLVNLNREITRLLCLAYIPMLWLVDIIPLTRFLPGWLPGIQFHAMAQYSRKMVSLLSNAPYAFVKQEKEKGVSKRSMVSSWVDKTFQDLDEAADFDGDLEDTAKFAAAVLHAGGVDTSLAIFRGFVFAMITNPLVQQRAQEEIDQVIGTNRLPTLEDRTQLPYVSALVKEALRWFTAIPLNIPHKADEEVTYRGYRIPKGSFLIVSHWWLLHDPEVYSDPFSFEPQRFLAPRNEPDPANVAFGSGRRICPGQNIAQPVLFIMMSRLLASFNMSKAVDAQGNHVEPKLEWASGSIAAVKEFPYSIAPRSQVHEELIRRVEVEHPWEKGDAEQLEIPADLDFGFTK